MSPYIQSIIQMREMLKQQLKNARSGKFRVRTTFERTSILKAVYQEPKRKYRLNLSDKTKVDHAIVTDEGDTYLVSILKQPNQNKESYVEVSMAPSHPLYERIKDVISVLNVAGTLVEIEGVGEAFQTGVYHVVLTPEEHAILLGG